MKTKRLGRTEFIINENAFGVLPLQRTEKNEAVRILRRAYDSGINFYDTARAYTDSEEKIGTAFSPDIRKQIYIATKTKHIKKEEMQKDIDTSLGMLKTDYVDILQIHNPGDIPMAGSEAYETLKKIQKAGKARYIGVSCHKLSNALKAAESGLYDTVQYPFSYLSVESELEFEAKCKSLDVGLIAMKALSGGLITNAKAAYCFFSGRYAVPIWGIQRMTELEDFIEYSGQDITIDGEMKEIIDKDKLELGGNFCRSCGYCLPCPEKINLPLAMRISFLLRRAPYKQFLSDTIKADMEKINSCQNCGLCASRCPYELDCPTVLKKQLSEYMEFYEEYK